MAVDVGIKNLAFCCMDNDYNVYFWDNVNLIEDETDNKCSSLTKKNTICNKKAKGKCEGNYMCKTHFPKNKKIIQVKPKKVNSFLLQDIALLVQEKINFIHEQHEEIHDIDKIVIELQPRVNQKMKFISHIIYSELVRLYKNTTTQVRFVPASRKLRGIMYKKYNLKNTYANRKKMSIMYVEDFIKNNESLMEKFKGFSKRDDACDTFAMCLQCF